MELTSKQRAQLRGMASTLDTIVHVGKDGIGENLIKQVNDALEARELIKGRVLENSMLTAREAAEELKVAARCEVVQVIGSKFVLYRMQHDKVKRKIELVKDRKVFTAGPLTPFTGAISRRHRQRRSSWGWTFCC